METYNQHDFTDETDSLRSAFYSLVIRVISVQKKEIYLRFIDSREVMSPRITGITRNFIRVIRVISVQKKKSV